MEKQAVIQERPSLLSREYVGELYDRARPSASMDDRSAVVPVLPDEMTRTNGRRARSGREEVGGLRGGGGLMGIVACRLFGGERGESK